MCIKPDAGVIRADATAGLNSSGLHDEQTGAPRNDAADVAIVPRLLETVDAGILAKRRDEDAIVEGHAADLEGLEQRRDGCAIGLRVNRGS